MTFGGPARLQKQLAERSLARGVNRMILGSDAEQVARLAPVPVLLVRSAERAASKATVALGKGAAARVDAATAT